MDNKNKDNVIYDFQNMIADSWTYDKMIFEERLRWLDVLYSNSTQSSLKGTYKARWDILNAIYHSYLMGLGYTDFNWRDEE